jgi:hypothetical protein
MLSKGILWVSLKNKVFQKLLCYHKSTIKKKFSQTKIIERKKKDSDDSDDFEIENCPSSTF